MTDESDITPEQFKCPKCKAARGYPCVYMIPLTYGSPQNRTPSNEHLWARAGTPSKKPHGERTVLAQRARDKAKEDEWVRIHSAIKPHIAEAVSIHKAEKQFDDIEQRKLVVWLMVHGSLLMQPPTAVDAG